MSKQTLAQDLAEILHQGCALDRHYKIAHTFDQCSMKSVYRRYAKRYIDELDRRGHVVTVDKLAAVLHSRKAPAGEPLGPEDECLVDAEALLKGWHALEPG